MKVFNNVADIVRDDMAVTMKKGSKVAIAAACFSMYAYNELKKQLEKEAAKARGKLPQEMQAYIIKNDEAYYLLETLARNELGSESLSQIIQMVEEQILC